MGRSIALTLAREGADIVLNYRKSVDRAKEVAAAIEALGRRVYLHQADTEDPDAVQAMVQAAESEFGHVDIAICSAGGRWKSQDFVDIEPEHWQAVMRGEVDSAYGLIRATLPGMRERRWGRIVMIGGEGADTWTYGPPDAPLDYPLGKAARHWLARTLGPRERANGITINAIAPGPIEHVELDEALRLAKEGPSGEITPQHVAEMIAYLCSERAAHTTGAIIPIRGSDPV
jgi:3-oxoacyl-[acyl-carrier protein] reductase